MKNKCQQCYCNPFLVLWLLILFLQDLKCKIKILEIYFNKKSDLSTYIKIKDYNVLLSFYFYLQDNDNYPLLNLILNQI
jgi:hypothetical protein